MAFRSIDITAPAYPAIPIDIIMNNTTTRAIPCDDVQK
jgi:hypothetical protein